MGNTWIPVHVLAALLLIQRLDNGLGKAEKMDCPGAWDPAIVDLDEAFDSWLLWLSWISPGHCNHFASDPVDESTLSTSL